MWQVKLVVSEMMRLVEWESKSHSRFPNYNLSHAGQNSQCEGDLCFQFLPDRYSLFAKVTNFG